VDMCPRQVRGYQTRVRRALPKTIIGATDLTQIWTPMWMANRIKFRCTATVTVISVS
jgi:hypothetical protein